MTLIWKILNYTVDIRQLLRLCCIFEEAKIASPMSGNSNVVFDYYETHINGNIWGQVTFNLLFIMYKVLLIYHYIIITLQSYSVKNSPKILN
jgi:hypothetical protein